MILLDTNVLSELTRPSPTPAVVAWLAANRHQLALSTITVAELAYGVSALPDGARRTALLKSIRRLISAYSNRLLTFTERAAWRYGDIMAQARAAGRPMSVPDGMLAAIASVNGCALATRNLRDFETTAVGLVDPWATDSLSSGS